MDPSVVEFALQAMDNLMKHPITSTFIDPIQTNDPFLANYIKVIKKPIDLSTIKERLQKGEYENMEAWFSDVDLVWNNAIAFHGVDSAFAIVAEECRLIFRKECRTLNRFSLGKWCSNLINIKNRTCELLGAPPPKAKQYLPNSTSRSSKHNMPLLTEKELKDFAKASTLFTSEDDNRAIFKIIEENEPGFLIQNNENSVKEHEEDHEDQNEEDQKENNHNSEEEQVNDKTIFSPSINSKIAKSDNNEYTFDVTKLHLQTIYALRNYFKSSLEKMGKEYPGFNQ